MFRRSTHLFRRVNAHWRNNSRLTYRNSVRQYTLTSKPQSSNAWLYSLKALALALPAYYLFQNSGQPQLEGKTTFSEHKLEVYENRIRKKSPLERVFRYFATLECEGEVLMTVHDLVRSMLPGELQPAELRMDQYKSITKEELEIRLQAAMKSQNLFVDNGQVFNFTEYLFLRSILEIPVRSFELAFQMFDEDGNGFIEKQEFVNILKSVTKRNSGSKSEKRKADQITRDDFLVRLIFHKNRERIDFDTYEKFATDFRRALLKAEYNKKLDANTSELSMRKFGKYLINIAGKKKDPEVHAKIDTLSNEKAITFNDFVNFKELISSVDELEDALSIFHHAHLPLNKALFKRACSVVTKEKISDDVLEVVFAVFDVDNDGLLSYNEFFSFLKKRSENNFSGARDFGAVRGFNALLVCIREQLSS